ncbi:MAG: hypothetical protein ABSC90_17455, partial [Acidimicrobiales bacterium]
MKLRNLTVLVAALLMTGTSVLAGTTAASAAAVSPPITLSPTSGPAGTTFTITLPSPCTTPTDAGIGVDPDALTVSFANVVGAEPVYQQYQGTPGVPITQVAFAVPADTAAGHYVVAAGCKYPSAPIGTAYFVVTGGSPLPPFTLSPQSGPAGTIINATGTCAPVSVTTSLSGGGQSGSSISVAPGTGATDSATLGNTSSDPTAQAQFFVSMFSDTDPNLSITEGNSGPGPTITTSLTVPSTFPPGTYFVTAACDNYDGYVQFAEVSFTVTGAAPTVTTLITELSSGGKSGASITVPPYAGVTDAALLSGTNSADAVGTVTYTAYSDSSCSDYAESGGTVNVVKGVVPASNSVSVGSGPLYWQASYSGDATNAPSTSMCGSEVETVQAGTAPITIATQLSSYSGAPSSSIGVEVGVPVFDLAVLTGPSATTASGTVTYTVYSDADCTTSAASGGTVKVSNGIVLESSAVELSTAGTYYWQASYSGDATNESSITACGSEVETVVAPTGIEPTSIQTSLSGGGQTGSSISVTSNTNVTDTATLSGPNAAIATGYMSFSVFSDAGCTDEVAGSNDVVVTNGVALSNPINLLQSGFITTTGPYYWQASYLGDDTFNSPSTSTCTAEVENVTTISQPTTLTTSLSGGGQSGPAITVPAGTAATDSATLSGATATAGGTVTYSVYSDPFCTQLVANAGTVSVDDGVVPDSTPVTLRTAGTYYWGVTYSGDSLNGASSESCSGETETTSAGASPLTITTTLSSGSYSGASLTVPSGASVTDSAAMTGPNASTATGTVTYSYYTDDACTQGGSFDTVTVTAGAVPSAAVPTYLLSPGTYYLQVSYGGDADNAAFTTACGSEVLTVEPVTTPAPTTIATTLSGGGQSGPSISVPVGTTVTDTATLSTGYAEDEGTGNFTYSVYSDSKCTDVVQSDVGAFGFETGVAGTYYWQASYSGDTINAPSTGTCGSEVETVTPLGTSIATDLYLGDLFTGSTVGGSSLTVPAGSSVTDVAELGAAGDVTGTATFTVYSDDNCATPVASGGTVSVFEFLQAYFISDAVTLTTPGTYYWQAYFSGDANNGPSLSPCGSEVETVTAGAPPTLTTTLSGGGQSGPTISVTAGTGVADAASLTDSSAATGTVTYGIYSDSTCTQLVPGTQGTVTVVDGVVPASNVTTLAPGTYYWQASYSGDSNYLPLTTACGSEVETVTAATVPSGTDPPAPSADPPASTTATVTYTVYSDDTCTTPVMSGGTLTIPAGGPIPPSNTVTLTTPGTYYWEAYYSGTSTSLPSTSICGIEIETITGTATPVTVSTSLTGGGQSGASVSVPAGTAVSDAATLAGADVSTAGGTVTYTAYSNDTCSTSAGSGGTVTVSGGVVPASGAVTLTTPGTYYWQAS